MPPPRARSRWAPGRSRSARIASAARRGEERQQAQEHGAPVERVGHDARDGRPHQPRHDPCRREHREHPRPQRFRDRPPDRDVARGIDRTGAQPLQEPCGDEDGHRRRQATERQADREQGQPRREGADDRPAIQQAAGHDDADEVAQEERREGPAVVLEPTEVAGDERHDRPGGERLERDERDRQDEAERQRPIAGREQVGGARRAAGQDGDAVGGQGHEGRW